MKRCWEASIRGRWFRAAAWAMAAALAAGLSAGAWAQETAPTKAAKKTATTGKAKGKGRGTAGAAKSHSKAKRAASGKTGRGKSTRKSARRGKITPPAAPKVVTAEAGTLAALGQAYRLKTGAAGAAGLERYAAAHAGTQAGGLAGLALAAYGTQAPGAARRAAEAAKLVPQLADYAAYFEALAEEAGKDHSGIPAAVAKVYAARPESPLVGRAALLEARVAVADGQAKRALEVLEAHEAEASPAGVALLRGRAYEALGKNAEAAEEYRKVFYDMPMAQEAGEAGQGIERLKGRPGYQPVSGERILRRAESLMEGGQYGQAREFLRREMSRLEGAERDRGQVDQLGARLLDGDARQAVGLLRELKVSDPEADAQRMYYLARAESRLDREPEMDGAVKDLAGAHPDSAWRERTLIAVGNRYLTENRPDEYLPLFRACYETFPDTPDAAYCHWKVVWKQYLDHGRAAEDDLKAHLRDFPRTRKADAAMYFLGRIAGQKGAAGEAAAWYGAILDRFPNSYYAMLARERMREEGLRDGATPAVVKAVVEKLPARQGRAIDFSADGVMKTRVERARLLASAGMDDYAETEMRYGAEHDGQAGAAAMELASIARQRDAVDQAIRYIKRYVPGYLNLPLKAAPERFWEYAFPLPYRKALEEYSGQHGLDPYLVAALIRQESEFNPRAVSVSKALGLTQVVPSTGKYLSRKVGITRFRTALLFQPEVNLRIGTYYLRTLLDGLQGSPEAALASYNAGKSRVEQWLTWSAYREPAEFVETIPFTQTRDYVEIVLHNADIYRRLYGNSQLRAAGPAAMFEKKFR